MTSKEFAKLIGVSQATVSRAMNDSELVPEAKRKYIQPAGNHIIKCNNKITAYFKEGLI